MPLKTGNDCVNRRFNISEPHPHKQKTFLREKTLFQSKRFLQRPNRTRSPLLTVSRLISFLGTEMFYFPKKQKKRIYPWQLKFKQEGLVLLHLQIMQKYTAVKL